MWIPLLIGIVLGAAWALGVIFALCEVETKEKWHERNHLTGAMWHRMDALVAENAQLRLSLAAGEMTEDGKKIAAMTMAALGNVMSAANEAIREGASSPVSDRLCERDQAGGVDGQGDVPQQESR